MVDKKFMSKVWGYAKRLRREVVTLQRKTDLRRERWPRKVVGKAAEEGGRKAAGRKSMSARLIIRRILVNFAGVKRNKE